MMCGDRDTVAIPEEFLLNHHHVRLNVLWMRGTIDERVLGGAIRKDEIRRLSRG